MLRSSAKPVKRLPRQRKQLVHELRGCGVLWYVYNTVVLRSPVKSMPKEVYISRIVEAVHIFMYRLNCRIWFEYVRSSDNWADGVSRSGLDDQLVISSGAECRDLEQCTSWWTYNVQDLWDMSI